MPPKITDSQRKGVHELLAQGFGCETSAAQVGVTPGQVPAVAAHVEMGTYERHGVDDTVVEFMSPERRERIHERNHRICRGVTNAFGRTNPTGVTCYPCGAVSGRKTT